jgi:hypothetical protein
MLSCVYGCYIVGQLTDSRDHLKLAQQFFQLVGASASECDTIPGRQCMASCFFLLKQVSMSTNHLSPQPFHFAPIISHHLSLCIVRRCINLFELCQSIRI